MGTTPGNGQGGMPVKHRNPARALRIGGLLTAAALACLLLLPLFDAQPAQLSAYSGHWNDLSEVRSLVKGKGLACRAILTGPTELSGLDPGSNVLVIIGVERGYSTDEISRISSFVRSGGALLLADDFGHGGELVRALAGDKVSLLSEHLRDIYFQKNPDFLRARLRAGNPLGLPAQEVMLNRPAALEVQTSRYAPYSYDPKVLVNASPHAWLDANGNLVRDADEKEYAYPVAAMLLLDGTGPIIVASDPGLFVNDMFGYNRFFVNAVVDSLTVDRSGVVFDESRHNPESAAGKMGSGVLRAAAGYAGNPLAIFLTFLFLLLVFGYQYNTLPPRTIRGHQDALDRPRLLHFVSPWVSIREFRRLRVAIVERVRLAYGYSPEDFYPAMLSSIPDLLGDPQLQRFLDYETYPDMISFQQALHGALNWRPPEGRYYDPTGTGDLPRIEHPGVEVVEEARSGTLDVEALFDGTVRLWNPAKKGTGGPSDVDSLLYGRGRPLQDAGEGGTPSTEEVTRAGDGP